ncbi:MAG: hypothetical protein IJ906_03770 [Oscillospiraceae bacterium]|nr:hypothetical protein [Oscillospiraceae bacterium]
MEGIANQKRSDMDNRLKIFNSVEERSAFRSTRICSPIRSTALAQTLQSKRRSISARSPSRCSPAS